VDRLPSNLPINGQSVGRVEVLAGPERRRRWSWKEKAQIVAESLAPNAVASTIARRYGLHPNQLYAWRKELRQTANEAAEAGGRRPVSCRWWSRIADRTSAIQIHLSGARVRVSARVIPIVVITVLVDISNILPTALTDCPVAIMLLIFCCNSPARAFCPH
jgi:transposase